MNDISASEDECLVATTSSDKSVKLIAILGKPGFKNTI